ncbi:uncharacterized protein B0H18DRAFT_1018751, partial [Fomitopsis serialis]|uniref:uncharacterized protein n=1 Tax=Fomitopsis serialis TaxID=139415 RepID=UPI002008CF6B
VIYSAVPSFDRARLLCSGLRLCVLGHVAFGVWDGLSHDECFAHGHGSVCPNADRPVLSRAAPTVAPRRDCAW